MSNPGFTSDTHLMQFATEYVYTTFLLEDDTGFVDTAAEQIKQHSNALEQVRVLKELVSSQLPKHGLVSHIMDAVDWHMLLGGLIDINDGIEPKPFVRTVLHELFKRTLYSQYCCLSAIFSTDKKRIINLIGQTDPNGGWTQIYINPKLNAEIERTLAQPLNWDGFDWLNDSMPFKSPDIG